MRVARGAVLLAIVMLFAVTLLAHSQASAPTITLNNPAPPPLGTVTLTGMITTANGADISTASVAWGDNKQDPLPLNTNIQASHTYAAPGQYTITVAVSDSNGNTASATAPVSVLQVASAPSPPSVTTGIQCLADNGGIASVGNCITDSFPLSIIGLLLSLVLVAISYMAGEIIEIGGLKKWYKKELWETGKSALIIAVILSTLVIASGIAAAVAGNTPVSTNTSQQSAGASIISNLDGLYSSAYSQYITPQLHQSYDSFGADLGLAMGTAALGSITVGSWLPVPIYVGAVQFGSTAQIYTSGYVQPAEKDGGSFMKNIMTIILVPVLLIFQFQSDLMPLIVVLGFAVFLPLGIILRAFPFLRPIGGTMIAIAMGASLIYPVLLVGFNLPVTDYFSAATGNTYNLPAQTCSTSGFSGILCVFFAGAANLLSDISPGSAILAATIGPGNINNFGSFVSPTTLYDYGSAYGFFDSINSIIPPLNFVINYTIPEILQFILFVFDIIIGLVLVNGISSALGGIDFSKRRGIGKFKLF